ncbi:MAG: response regulator transcription factor [Gemmatimonadota bacterium]
MTGDGRRGQRIVVIEDEPSLLFTLEDRLRAEGYDVLTAEDGLTGEERVMEADASLVILDLNLPGKDGLDVCRDLRARGADVPILVLTARGDVTDRVVGLKLGADDYLPKPFSMLELLARMEALLRRGGWNGEAKAGCASFGDVQVDFDAAVVDKGGETVKLSALELRLLRYFVEHAGKVLSRNLLLDEVWGYDATPVTRTVDVHVASLRQKLESSPSRPRHIVTVHGRGYKFVS